MALTPERYLRNGVKHSLQADVSRALKRALDLALSFIGLVIAIPVLSMVAIAIRMESRGPISYVQQRIGRDRRVGERRRNGLDVRQERRKAVRRSRNLFGMPFRIYKFRTMHLNAEEGSGPVWAVADDPRATRIGRYLRLIRLDEIPQFFNVLRGEMSLVGPRPERPEFVEALVEQLPHYTVRLRTKPGITGTAQINTGYDSSLDDVRRKLDHDIHYINNRSLIRDIRIILKTFWIVVTGFGAK